MRKNVRLEEVGDELILREDEPLVATVLDPLYARIYRLAVDGKSVGEIEQASRTVFRFPPEHDVRQMVAAIPCELVDQGFGDEEPLPLGPRYLFGEK